MSDTNGLNQMATSWSIAVPEDSEKTLDVARETLKSLPNKYPALEAFLDHSQDDNTPDPDMY